MSTSTFTPYERVLETFESVLAASPADETELVWLERRYGAASNSSQDAEPQVRPTSPEDFLERPRLSVLVRVVEGGRQGWYRTETPDSHLLESGVRQALALAKVQEKAKRRPVLPRPRDLEFDPLLWDEDLVDLDLDTARGLVADWCGDDGRGRLTWSETRLAIFNSHGLRRKARATEATFYAETGSGPGTGRACGSARSLKELDAPHIFLRAKETRRDATATPLEAGAYPILLAPEASIELINLLNAFALSGRSYLDGTSFLSRHRNVQVFSRDIHLVDDGTRRPGLPFPFDLEGSPKAPLELIVKGQPTTPALTKYQGGQAGLESTAQAVGGQDALFGNLFLQPGEADVPELLAAAEDGLFIGWLDALECFDPSQLHFRAIARSVRRIRDGRLAEPVEDQIWEESLLRTLARLRSIGRDCLIRNTPTTVLGAISAPALVLDGSDGLRSPSR